MRWSLQRHRHPARLGDIQDVQDERSIAVLRENLRRYVAGERMLNVVDIARGYELGAGGRKGVPASTVLPRKMMLPQLARIAWILLLTGAGIGAVLYSLLVPGPFDWHVALPEVWQGAIEIVVVLAWTWAALSLARTTAWRAALVLPVLALYLRRHHVDLELLITLLYFEGLFALGVLFVRDAAPDAWLRRVTAGVVVLSLALWLAQLQLGLPRTQRVLALH